MIKEIISIFSMFVLLSGLIIVPWLLLIKEQTLAIMFSLFAIDSFHYIWIMKLELDIKKLKKSTSRTDE